ncbi:hypothetical protein M758_9G060900 [Ceratodon purpureus]|nr:hypothetical protein M758_9G060900 [Ceratodon purpureus]
MACLIRSLLLLLTTTIACFRHGAMAEYPKVFAHYMQYADVDISVYKNEIELAQSKGIDAFALNTNVWRQPLADRMYQAAQELGSNFKLFFSADMHIDSNGQRLSSQDLQAMLAFHSHPNQMYIDGKALFTSWLGNDTNWNDVFQEAGGKDLFFFIPFFPTDGSPSGVRSMLQQWGGTIDGLFSWDTSAWNMDGSLDRNYLSACNDTGKTYMASVSPWFFTTSNDCKVKANYEGPKLWLTKWKEMIDLSVPLVEIVTWNDWVESSYVASIFPGQGDAASAVSAFPHEAFLELGSYFIDWYKSGLQPGISSNSMYMFYVTQSKNAGGCLLKSALDDKVYVVTMLSTEGGTLVINSGSRNQSFSAGVGVSSFSMDFEPGKQSASFGDGKASLVGEQVIRSDADVGASNLNVYSKYLNF